MITVRYINEYFKVAAFSVLVALGLSALTATGIIVSDWDYVMYIVAVWGLIVLLDLSTREYRFDGRRLRQVRALRICSKAVLSIPTRTIGFESIKNVKLGPSKFYGLIDDEALYIEYDNRILKISTDFQGAPDLYEALHAMIAQRSNKRSTL